jgi:hypothetical protein
MEIIRACQEWDPRVHKGIYLTKCISFAKSKNEDRKKCATELLKTLCCTVKERFGKEMLKKLPRNVVIFLKRNSIECL